MPTERELIQQCKATEAAGQAALVRFLGECFTETLLVRENVDTRALAARFAAKLREDEKSRELQAILILEYLKSWLQSGAEKIARARKTKFTEKSEDSEIYDETRLALRDRDAEETRKKLEAWKLAEAARRTGAWPARASENGGSRMVLPAAPFKA